jgi:phosphatidylglycerophosphate synthase
MVQPAVCPHALTPNQVSFMACAMGLLAALCLAHGSWVSGVLGALLLQWSAVIDCCDGEVARLKFLESTSGYYLDITCDNIVHVAVFIGIAWSGYQGWGSSMSCYWGHGRLWDPDGLYHGAGHTT